MPIGSAHTTKRSKNLVALAVLLLMVAGFYYLTVLKITQNRETSNPVATTVQ